MSEAPIRVAGLGAWLAGARGPAEVKARLARGEHAFAPVPPLRWDPDVFAEELPEGHPRCELGATLGEVEVDWRALRLPPLSVARMHDMEKAALSVMADALADAGIEPRQARGERVRVYLAATTLGPDPRTDHGRRIRRHELAAPVAEALQAHLPSHAAEVSEYVDSLFNLVAPPVESDSMASSASILAGRIGNLYDFGGGHVAIDCSAVSSLAAVEAAMDDLRAGACDVALVCAISPLLTASGMLAMAHRGLLSAAPPRPFAPDADGTLLGEGAVALVLDRGDGAPRDRARGWLEAVAGVSLPRRAGERLASAVAQACTAALSGAGCAPGQVAFVATRAAGIRAIDEPEAAALAGAYGTGARAGLPLACSAQTFGHLGGASGMVALLQALLALEEGCLHAPRIEGTSARGLGVGASDHVLASDARAGVSDCGLAPRAYHAIVAGPDAHARRSIEASAEPFEPLAITGLGVVIPGAESTDVFWQNVLGRVESIGDLPAERWDVDRFIDASEELGAVLKTRLAAPVALPTIDPARHRLSPTALSGIDPAVLLCLESADQALRESGGVGSWPSTRVGVFSGQLSMRWAEAELEKRVLFASHLALVGEALRESNFDEATIAAVSREARARFDVLNARLSSDALGARTGLECAAHVARVAGLDGPMLSVDAACASSLAAIERAARKLARREVDAALALGVAYNLLPEYYVVLSILGALSPRGAAPFHVGADGFVPGEGAAAVVLERLEDAERRGARIHAVIRSIGVSSDGAGVSIFAPNGRGELRAIGRALEAAGVTARDVDLVEAHGTGTKLGDETEVAAYLEAYGDRDPTTPLTVGTVKSQVGHLSSAAGMVGLVKTTLALREAVLPPTLGDEPAPELERGPLQLPADARPWVVPRGRKRLAGVSAFGLGGVNYHLIVEEPPAPVLERRAEHPPAQARRPARAPEADRFEVELVPRSLGAGPPRAPLAGRTVWVLPDRGELWRAIGAGLEARGARVVLITSEQALHAAPDADGVLDLSTFGATDDDPLSPEVDARATARVQAALAAVQRCYPRMTDPPHAFYAAITSLGGDLGLGGAAKGDLAGSALIGLAKGLKQELPKTASRAIDFDPDEAPETVAEVVLRELEDGNDQLEVAWAGRRMVSRLRRLPLEDDVALRPVSDDDVILVSGGGRGVVFECATALARLGAKVVVTGRTAPPEPDAPYLALDDDAFETWGRERMRERKRETPSASPRQLKAEIEGFRRARELAANLKRAERDGLAIEYVRCDVMDRDAVRRLVEDVRKRLGPITGLAHGAMVQWSTIASRKEPDKIAATLAVKSESLAHLLEATAGDPLSVVLCFGSGAGRFGNRGQADYCAANALMAARLAAYRRHDPRPTRFVTVDWTAWDSVGAAVEDADLAELLRATGITSISVEEGLYWFLREWTAGTSGEVVVFEERMLHDWPFLGRQAERRDGGPVEVDDLGRPLVEGAWPLIDRVVEQDAREQVFERRFDVRRDAFLDQHRLHGVPILPATFGCELLAEVAALSVPGMEIDTAFDVRIETPAKLFHERPLLLRAHAERLSHDMVRCSTRSRLTLRGRELSQRVHHGGRFRLRPVGSAPPERLAIEELEGTARARSFFHMARDPVMLGPLYSRGQWIQIRDRTVIGVIRAPRQRDATDRTSWPTFQIDPLVMDTAFQIAANWDGFGEGHVSIPYGIEELRMGRRRGRGENARVRAVVTRVDDPDVYYDIDVSSEDGDMLMAIRGLHLRRIDATEP